MEKDLDSNCENLQTRLSAPITGFADYDPKEQYLFNYWIKTIQSSYESFGFTPIHLRPFERLNALKGEGETQKQIFEVYRADTCQTTHLGLPFDHTVPLALWVAENAGHKQNLTFPYKRYDLGLSFRGERPKTGRARAFIQADVDIVGRKLSIGADAECIATISSSLEKLAIGKFTIKVNHIGIVKSILANKNIAPPHHACILRCIDKLDKLTIEEVAKEISQIKDLSLNMNQIQDLISSFSIQLDLTKSIENHPLELIAADFVNELKELTNLINSLNLKNASIVFSAAMVRGLDYYTGIVFETFLDGKEHFGSIASGGRYSNLVGEFFPALVDVEGVGGSIGLTRIFDVLRKTHLEMPNKTSFADILVGARTQELSGLSYKVSAALRQAGLKVDCYNGAYKIKNVLTHANNLGVNYSALIMDDNCIVIKNMSSQEQKEFSAIENVISFFQNSKI